VFGSATTKLMDDSENVKENASEIGQHSIDESPQILAIKDSPSEESEEEEEGSGDDDDDDDNEDESNEDEMATTTQTVKGH